MDIENLEEKIGKMKIEIDKMYSEIRRMKIEVEKSFPTIGQMVVNKKSHELRFINKELNELMAAPTYTIGLYTFDVRQRLLYFGDKFVKLTNKETYLLVVLAANINCMIEREYILNIIWGEGGYQNARSMDVFLCKIRKFLDKDPNIVIVNVHGKGYRIIVG